MKQCLTGKVKVDEVVNSRASAREEERRRRAEQAWAQFRPHLLVPIWISYPSPCGVSSMHAALKPPRSEPSLSDKLSRQVKTPDETRPARTQPMHLIRALDISLVYDGRLRAECGTAFRRPCRRGCRRSEVVRKCVHRGWGLNG